MALTPEQLRVLRQLQAAPSYGRATPKVRKALIEAALVESNLSTPDQAHSDRDSEGALQQRPSQGWGPTSESNTTDAEQFLRRAIPLRRKYGSAGALAQAVQVSQYPERYNQRGSEASSLLGRSRRDNAAGGSNPLITLSGGSGGSTDASEGTQTNLALLAALEQQKPQVQSAGIPSPAHTAAPVMPEGYEAPVSGGGPSPPPDLNPLLQVIQTQGSAPQAPQGSDITVTPGSRSSQPRLGGGAAGKGAFKITGPNPGRIKPEVRDFARKVSSIAGETIVGSDGTGHSKYTVNGNVSDHFSGNATDVPASGRELVRLGRAALIAAGMPRKQALKQTGGLFNVNGHQVIFNTQEGGDHTDHLHISARRR